MKDEEEVKGEVKGSPDEKPWIKSPTVHDVYLNSKSQTCTK